MLPEAVGGLCVENCNDNKTNKTLYWSLPIVIILLNIKDNINITPPPFQASSGYQYTTLYCNISSDMIYISINCLDFDVNYTIAIYSVNYCNQIGKKQEVWCLYLNDMEYKSTSNL